MKKVLFLIIICLFISCNWSKPEKPQKKQSINEYVTARNGLALRELPDKKKGKLITTIPFKAKVKIIKTDKKTDTVSGIKGTWKKISWRKHTGWANAKFLSDELYCTKFINSLVKEKLEGTTINHKQYHIHLMKNNKADIDLHENGIKGRWYISKGRVIIRGIYDYRRSYNFDCSEGGATKKQFEKCVKNTDRKMKKTYGKINIPVKVKFKLVPLSNSQVLVQGKGRDRNPVPGKKIFQFSFKEKFTCEKP